MIFKDEASGGLPLVSHPYIEPGSAVSISMLRTGFTVELDREALALLAARVGRFGRVSRRAA